jgi:hypothetical protein
MGGNVHLSPEAEAYFAKMGCKVASLGNVERRGEAGCGNDIRRERQMDGDQEGAGSS